jgi:leucyl aminopeptidase
MEVKVESRPASKIDVDLLVVGVFQDEKIKDVLTALDAGIPATFVDNFADECERETFNGKTGQSIQLPTYGAIACRRLLVRGLGKKADATTAVLRKGIGAIAKKLSSHTGLETAAIITRLDDKEGWRQETAAQAIVEGWLLGSYSFTKYKTQKEDKKKENKLKTLFVVVPEKTDTKLVETAAARGLVIAECTNFARDLIAEPPIYMTPTRLAEEAKNLNGGAVQCEVLDKDDVEKLGMGAFLGVARGASQPPKFIIMRYSHADAKKTIAIAGKGITFDSGGLSIKTAQGMETMKYDMSGAAATLATMRAVRELKPKINVVAVMPATENMPSGTAMHPGDVITAMNGKTIEVNNTDAEGRLILADALAYLAKEKPDEIIDIATLTGAVVTALGRAAAGIMGNDQAFIQRVIDSGAEAGEKYWQLPLFDEYKETLKSDIADLKNAGARGEAATSSAAMFLKEFVDGRPWTHLDIAGPGWIDKEKDDLNKGGTAFGLRTLCYYILSQAEL